MFADTDLLPEKTKKTLEVVLKSAEEKAFDLMNQVKHAREKNDIGEERLEKKEKVYEANKHLLYYPNTFRHRAWTPHPNSFKIEDYFRRRILD